MFVADGAGSAARGGDGAELAMAAAASFVEKKLQLVEFGLSDALAVECVTAVRSAIESQANADSLKPRDFACTFLGVLSFERGTLLMQVGDGGIAIDVGSGLELPIVPMGGEYANQTNFVTDDNAISVLKTKEYERGLVKVAAFSDGLQRLALNLAAGTVHEPFFSPFFTILAKSSLEQEDELTAALVRFLGSAAVNERTDDDKTLALAILSA